MPPANDLAFECFSLFLEKLQQFGSGNQWATRFLKALRYHIKLCTIRNVDLQVF